MNLLLPPSTWNSKPDSLGYFCVFPNSFLCHTDENKEDEAKHWKYISPKGDVDDKLRIREPGVGRYGGDDVKVAVDHGPGIWNQSSGVADDQIDVEWHCNGNVGACETQEPNELTSIETTVRAFE
jgi:hypothetical protein